MTKKKTQKKDTGIDYAAAADAHADAADESGESSVEDENLVSGDSSAAEDQSEHDSGSEGNSSEDEEERLDEDQENSVGHAEPSQEIILPTSATGEQCTFDLRNLLAMNAHQINTAELYSTKKKSQKKENVTICPESADVVVNEDYLLEKATEGCSRLIEALWQLPVERSDAGPMVALPAFDEIRIPRALPLPEPKKETKWEKFAKERGIPLNKSKRSQKVWDETTRTWMYRHGYQKANDDNKEWPIMEVKANQDPFEDPWELLREDKRSRTEKNLENRMRNKERAGELPKGTTTRVLKSREKSRQAGKAGGKIDRDNVVPTGVPVDLKPTKASDDTSPAKRGKESITAALHATQRSTASLGKFDRMREGEPERKKAVTALKKRKFESATDKKAIASEAERSLKVLKSVVDGGGVAREKARKKGRLATGETAYDYEFDDGLGPSTFKKKKGRAGAGKMKKMTKKRAK